VLAAPSTALYQPLNRQPWGEWALLGAFAIAGTVALVLLERLGRARAVASRLARVDPLTGLPNRRAVDEAFVRMAAHANRNGYQLAVLSIDLDHFKTINDTFGHKIGDQALTATGLALRGTVRTEDVVGRWGGEEFLVVLADASREGARRAADRMRVAITESAARAGIPGRLTASIGGAIDHPLDLESLLRTADRALYVAKDQGRDRVHLADDPVAAQPEPSSAV
jgi:diguanylate cyclase (GGDEF)-like protein